MRPLKIAGFQRSSTSEFPNKTAFVVFTQGCNLRCPWCRQNRQSGDAYEDDETGFDPDKCLDFIKARLGQIDGVALTGGEPLLQDSLPGFLAAIKELGLAIKLDTNGTMPHRLSRILDEDLVDYVALDIKAPPSSAGAYCIASGGLVDTTPIQDTIELVAHRAPQGEFRTTVLPGFHTYEMLDAIVSELPLSIPYFLQIFVPEQARSGLWASQRRWSLERLENIAAQLSLAHPLHWIQARP